MGRTQFKRLEPNGTQAYLRNPRLPRAWLLRPFARRWHDNYGNLWPLDSFQKLCRKRGLSRPYPRVPFRNKHEVKVNRPITFDEWKAALVKNLVH